MSEDTLYQDYDLFAWAYNKHWGDMFTGASLYMLEKLVLPHLPANARILDLCCGTGQLIKTLAGRGYRITGLDGSAEMLRFARENAPDAEFVHEDARYFKLPPVYHAAISAFDSLNHIMTLEELTSAFCNVYAALTEGGIFLFDLNTEVQHRTHWDGSVQSIVEDDNVCVTRMSYDAEEQTARFDATIFRLQEGAWQRADFTLIEKPYSEAEIRPALQVAGFVEIDTHALDRERGLVEVTAESGRVFFICRKAGGEG
ncbi:MAG TPA: class I SAM-dependent methyltransferase [Dehalococcoidia bacterium]|nr:class I SAM-dependent methyltransferase [Dehalococcoidia bacterium]